MMILQVILEGIGLGVLLILVCAIGIRKGAVGMVHLTAQRCRSGAGDLQHKMAGADFQSGMRSQLCCLCAGLRYAVNGARGFPGGLLACWSYCPL